MAAIFKSVCYPMPTMEEYHKAVDPMNVDYGNIAVTYFLSLIIMLGLGGYIYLFNTSPNLPLWPVYIFPIVGAAIVLWGSRGALYYLTKYKTPLNKAAEMPLIMNETEIVIGKDTYSMSAILSLQISYNSYDGEAFNATVYPNNMYGYYKIKVKTLEGVDNSLVFETADGKHSFLFLVKQESINSLAEVMQSWHRNKWHVVCQRRGHLIPSASEQSKYVE